MLWCGRDKIWDFGLKFVLRKICGMSHKSRGVKFAVKKCGVTREIKLLLSLFKTAVKAHKLQE